MKKLKDLKGAKELSKKEQQAIKGGLACIAPGSTCPGDTYCCDGLCRASWQTCLPF